MRLLLCGGGTAGHVTPAIAIAEELIKKAPDSEILFVGRDGGEENHAVLRAGFQLETLKICGIQRRLCISNIKNILTALESRKEARKIIESFKPDVILGTGGYVCWPIISVGSKMKIPSAIHESNAYPGLTTKLLERRCEKVFLGMEEAKKYLKNKNIMTVGNPIPSRLASISKKAARRRLGLGSEDLFILSFGGSIGARRLNEVLIEVMESHSVKENKLWHLHASGIRYYASIKSKCKDAQVKGCRIVPYIEDMPTMLSAADIVISRSGAMTLSEISAAGVCAILIPSPNVSGNHQYKNAKHLSDRGAAMIIEEEKLTADILKKELIFLENDKTERKNRAKKIKALSTPDSAKLIAEQLILMKKA